VRIIPPRLTAVSAILFVTACLFLLAGCYLFPKEEKVLAPPMISPPSVSYATVEAKKGTIESKTTVNGDFVPADQTTLYFRFSGGRLLRITVRLGDQVKPGALVAELDNGSVANRIAQQKILVRKAELASERTVALGRDRFERELAALDVELAKLQLQQLQQELDQSRLLATTGGTVIYVARAREGDLVEAYQTMVQLADPKSLLLVYKGDKAGDFPLGSRVTVGVSGRDYPGEVVMAPGGAPPDVSEELRGAIVVKASGLPAQVKYGDNASITRILARRERVLIIPRDLVHSYLGRDFVRMMEQGQVKEKTITLGVQTATEVEVASGLAEGDAVLTQ
jgi:macrolide-specific efflux system membrane fusion protein